jgi:hypothetical protein
MARTNRQDPTAPTATVRHSRGVSLANRGAGLRFWRGEANADAPHGKKGLRRIARARQGRAFARELATLGY